MRAQAEFLHGLGQKRPGQGVVVKGRDGPEADLRPSRVIGRNLLAFLIL